MKTKTKVQFVVGAYRPNGEKHPVLSPMLVTTAAPFALPCGPVARRGDPVYSLLLECCGGKPLWRYSQLPQPL